MSQYNKHIHRPLKHDERVSVIVEHQKDIPVGANPFHYDLENMGTPMFRGWQIMHQGADHEDNPRPANYFILVNQRTGQRIKINIVPETPVERDAFLFYRDTDTISGVSTFFHGPALTSPGLRWQAVDPIADCMTRTEAMETFVFTGNIMIRTSEFIKGIDVVNELCDDVFCENIPEARYQELLREVNENLPAQDKE